MGGWVEDRGRRLGAPLDNWQPPPEWGVGAHAKHLRNLYVYFWRWAAWKVFGGDPYRGGTDKSETKWTDGRGVVCFITVAGFLNGPGLPLALLTELSAAYGRVVAGPDLFAYIAAVAASPAYTARFRENLKQPGLRIPITAERALFDEAVELGREVVWLHTFGERFNEGRPAGPPRVDKAEPVIPAGGALPAELANMPHELDHDAASRRLKIGSGFVANVSREVWAYEISGKNVLSQWWSYRRQDRSKPPMGDKRPPSKLSEIQPTIWPAGYTTELLALLRVLTRLVALEPRQADLLTRIVNGPTIDSDTLSAAGSLSEASADASESEEGDEDG